MSTKIDIICERLHVQQRDHASKTLLFKEIENMDKDEKILKQYVQKLAADKRLILLELYRVNKHNKLFKNFSKEQRNNFKMAIKQMRKATH